MNKRRNFTAKFKTKVVLEALSERQTITEPAQKHKLHPNQISKWKQEFLSGVEIVFKKWSKREKSGDAETDRLYKIIGEQKVDIDFLNKALS
ncbi:MAG: transposase [Bacteroidales bacterium]|nr:transposase [Bacteroidales bacterium]